jgi:hypothetical protein
MTRSSQQQDLARKAVLARRLTDPLGAKGHRRPGDRFEREARLRRGMFTGSLAIFAASFALVTATGTPGHDAAAPDPVMAPEVAQVISAKPPVQANVALPAARSLVTTTAVSAPQLPLSPVVTIGAAQDPATASRKARDWRILGNTIQRGAGSASSAAGSQSRKTGVVRVTALGSEPQTARDLIAGEPVDSQGAVAPQQTDPRQPELGSVAGETQAPVWLEQPGAEIAIVDEPAWTEPQPVNAWQDPAQAAQEPVWTEPAPTWEEPVWTEPAPAPVEQPQPKRRASARTHSS